jgi:hypothetical protein
MGIMTSYIDHGDGTASVEFVNGRSVAVSREEAEMLLGLDLYHSQPGFWTLLKARLATWMLIFAGLVALGWMITGVQALV